MRLSDVLSRAPDSSSLQIEGFLGTRRLKIGVLRSLSVGKVVRNYFCRTCENSRTFVSSDSLSCLVSGISTVSVDVVLRCALCSACVEVWYLVRAEDDLYSQAPTVHLERFTENRRDAASVEPFGEVGDMLERAQIAFEDHLGAGAMVYLRQAFERITKEAAKAGDISLTSDNGSRRSFRTLLEMVDTSRRIIPPEFSANGYQLFSELSEIIHGNAHEEVALQKYEPCRRLVVGIVENIRNSAEMSAAIRSLGWSER